MKLLFCIPDLGFGGAERVVTNLSNQWAGKHDVTILTLATADQDAYQLEPSIKRLCINRTKKKWYMFLSYIIIVFKIRFVFNSTNCDFIISFLPKMNILSLLAAIATNHKVIVSERNIINDPDIDRRQHFLRKIIYPKAYKITVQHEEIYKELIDNYPQIPTSKIYITPNPVKKFVCNSPEYPGSLFKNYPDNAKLVIGVGRFTATKAFKELITVFKIVNELDDSIRFVIFGDGDEYDECVRLRSVLGLDEYLSLPGPAINIDRWYKVAHLFVTTTYYEGFPNALAEALSAGLPAIAYSAPSISVLLKHEVNGYIIPARKATDMAKGIISLLNDPDNYRRYSIEAATISDKFDIQKMNKIWINEVLC